jgi:uncharacterized protein YjbI with pentapeptide repeats
MDLRGLNLQRVRLDGSNLEHANLERVNLHDAAIVGANLQNANLRNADLENAAVCSNNSIEDDNGNVVLGRVVCSRFDGADLHGANLRHVRRCVWVRSSDQCTPATAQMLRDEGHADLTGALAP